MRTLFGLTAVLAGSFLAIIGLLGAIGAGVTLRVLPGRRPITLASLPARVEKDAGERVVVRGTVAAGPGGTYRSPLSDTECVWYLASQTVADPEGRRSSVDRYPPHPFALTDPEGHHALIGPSCPGLEQIPPSFRDERQSPHPWFDEAPALPGGLDGAPVEVYEFVLTPGVDLLASGDLGRAHDGTPSLHGDVSLSAGGEQAADGDPARRVLRRDLLLAAAGGLLIAFGSLTLSTIDSPSDVEREDPPGLIRPE